MTIERGSHKTRPIANGLFYCHVTGLDLYQRWRLNVCGRPGFPDYARARTGRCWKVAGAERGHSYGLSNI